MQIKLRTRSSSSVKLQVSADGYGTFANYRSPQVSLHLHLNLVQHMSSKLVFLPIASPVRFAFSSTLPVASKLLNGDEPVFDSGSNDFH